MNDHITSYSFEPICDYIYDNKSQDNPKNNDVVFCQMENIPLFFSHCNQTSNKYTVVSVRSDLGLEEQALAHPNKDVLKSLNFVDWAEFDKRTDVYIKLQMAEIMGGLCKPKDKYSIKIYAKTHCTFEDVPENIIKWFACNVNIRHPRIINIPFGLGQNFSEDEYFLKDTHKDKLLYVNFSNHTLERKVLNTAFRTQNNPLLTQREIPLDRKSYLREMSQHKFVLCPRGNGWDCWRTYESLYLGCIPVMERSIFSSFFEDLPVLIVDDFFQLTDTFLDEKYEEMFIKTYNLDKLFLSYWKGKIREQRN